MDRLLIRARDLHLARHPAWLGILHYEKGKDHSVILSKDFFYSPEGNHDPSAELQALIKGYFSESLPKNDAHPRCQFPARYYWLAQNLPLPDYTISPDYCSKLNSWNLHNQARSISLLLVSGFLGNPASTFGHSILKINTGKIEDGIDFYDLTLSYGARLPDEENGFVYILRGLFGGYQASFSDRYFYIQDLVYTRKEFRDMWEYKLNLSDQQKKLLVLHIWEIVTKDFQYFFFNKNCAYRLAELMDMVLDENVLRDYYPWYMPEDLFNKLKDIDQKRLQSHQEPIIASVQYRPSSQKKLYQQLLNLNKRELELFNEIIANGLQASEQTIQSMPPTKAIPLLDSLLAYHHYRLMAERDTPKESRKKMKDEILLARLSLPAEKRMQSRLKENLSPADGTRPMEISMGIAQDRLSHNLFTKLSWSPYTKETVGRNNLEGDEFTILDFSLGLWERNHDVFLDKADLLYVLSLNKFNLHIQDEPLFSWRLRLGIDRTPSDISHYKFEYDGVFELGTGYTKRFTDHFLLYGLLNGELHTQHPHFRIYPQVGLQTTIGKWKIHLQGGVQSSNYKFELEPVWQVQIQRFLNERVALFAESKNKEATSLEMGIKTYW
ncbi:MAG: DUF4105 domain-containing protein [Candidatus Omnitrophica bacterium]|nr:DUF4105 domain-containing protein [Candidatus Omnitrophota bacterium]